MMSKKATKEALKETPKEASKLKPMAVRAIAAYARLFSQITTPASDNKIAEDTARLNFASDIRDAMEGHTFKAARRAAKKVFTSLVGTKLNRAQRSMFLLSVRDLELLSLRPPSSQAKSIGKSYFARVKRTQMMKLAAAQLLENNGIPMTKKNITNLMKAARLLIPAAVYNFVERTFGKTGREALAWADKNLGVIKSKGWTIVPKITPKGSLRTTVQAVKVTSAAIRFADQVREMTNLQGAMQLFIQRTIELWYQMDQQGLSPLENEGYRGTIAKAAANEAFQLYITGIYGPIINAKVQVVAISADAAIAFYQNVVAPMHRKLEERYPTMKQPQLRLDWKNSGGGLAFTPMANADDIISIGKAFGNAPATISKYFSGIVNLCYLSATGTEQERVAQTRAYFLDNRTYGAFGEKRKEAIAKIVSRIDDIANWDTVGKTVATAIGAKIIFTLVGGAGAVASSSVAAPIVGVASIVLGIYSMGELRSKQQAEEKEEEKEKEKEKEKEEEEEQEEDDDDDDDEDLTPIDNMDDPVVPKSTGGPKDTPLLPAPGDETSPVAQVQEKAQKQGDPTGAVTLAKNIVEGYNQINAMDRLEALKTELENARKANKLMLEREAEQLRMTARAEETDALRLRIARRYQLEDSLDEISSTVTFVERRERQQQMMDRMRNDFNTALEKEGNIKFRNQTTAELRTRIAERGEQMKTNMKKIIDRRSGLIGSPIEEKEAEISAEIGKTPAAVDAIEARVRSQHGHYMDEDTMKRVIELERKKDAKKKKDTAARDKETRAKSANEEKEGDKMEVDEGRFAEDTGEEDTGGDEFFDADEKATSEDRVGEDIGEEDTGVDEFFDADEKVTEKDEFFDVDGTDLSPLEKEVVSEFKQSNAEMSELTTEIVTRGKISQTILRGVDEDLLADLLPSRPPPVEDPGMAMEEKEGLLSAENRETLGQLRNPFLEEAKAEALVQTQLENARRVRARLDAIVENAQNAYDALRPIATDAATLTSEAAALTSEIGAGAAAGIMELPATLSAIARDEVSIFGGESGLTFSELVADTKAMASYVVSTAPNYIRGGQFVTDAVQATSDLLSYGVSRQPALVTAAVDVAENLEFAARASVGLAVEGRVLPSQFNRAQAQAATETMIGPVALIKTLFDELGLTRAGSIIAADIIHYSRKVCISALQYAASTVIDTAIQGVRAAPAIIGRVIVRMAAAAQDLGAQGIAIMLEQLNLG